MSAGARTDAGEVIYERRTDEGEWSTLWAARDRRGAWVISGQELGRSLVGMLGSSEYEFWITLPLKDSHDITIDMLRDAAAADGGGSRPLTRWLRGRRIRYRVSHAF